MELAGVAGNSAARGARDSITLTNYADTLVSFIWDVADLLRVNVLFEAFVLDHIDARSSFALETTLRSADRRHVDRHLEGAAGPSVCRQCGEAELENVATARVDRLLAAVDSFGGT